VLTAAIYWRFRAFAPAVFACHNTHVINRKNNMGTKSDFSANRKKAEEAGLLGGGVVFKPKDGDKPDAACVRMRRASGQLQREEDVQVAVLYP
jgi:hypothetical protein